MVRAGTNIDVTIDSRYNTYGFGGQKVRLSPLHDSARLK